MARAYIGATRMGGAAHRARARPARATRRRDPRGAHGLLPDHAGIAELSHLAVKVRYASGRTRIESVLHKAADAAGLTREDLEELAVPDFALVDGARKVPFGPGAALLEVEGPRSIGLRWSVDGRAGLWNGSEWTDAAGARFEASEDSDITLWHPMDAEPDQVLAWRDRLESLGRVQPFKQAWHEVYALAPAELQTDTYSNRFAAHVVRQQPLKALCHQRGWSFDFVGMWDGLNDPTPKLPGGHSVTWMVEPVEGEARWPAPAGPPWSGSSRA